jgi:oxygen-independent coproporphyrinogen III oxidase
MIQAKTLEQLGIGAETIREYNQRIPRYTSYPTAPCWTETFDADKWSKHLEEKHHSSRDLSIYFHIPFCQKHCLFCACNTIITPKNEVALEYINYLEKEVDLIFQTNQPKGSVVQLHFGGGTPNYLDIAQLSRVVQFIRDRVPVDQEAEISIEVDPRVATPEDMDVYYNEIGFRRISFGTQDFNEETQQAIGREQTRDITFANVEAARRAGFKSVNLDLIYGLPRQTEATWSATIDEVCALRPDRIALYNFAFLPSKIAHQRALLQEQLPEPELKLQMFIESHNRLTEEGYVFIGMDHYALKDDSLAQALEQGTLHRNFMGYTTLRGVDMLSFGTSSISDFHGAFAQNNKKLSVYKRALHEGRLPTERGLLLSQDDLFRRYVIEEVMCNGHLRFDLDPEQVGGDVQALVQSEMVRLQPLCEDGLIELDSTGLRVTTKGRIFLRNIAVIFDAYMSQKGKKPLFSKAV